MRQTFLALAVAAVGGFALANCGNGSNNSADMGRDMAGSGGSGGGQDMAAGPKLNCLGVGGCILQCVTSGTGDINSCFTMCSKQAKAGSANKWGAAFICGQDYCDPRTDMMGKCVEVPDPANPNNILLCDPGQTFQQCSTATTPGTCAKCIANARNLIYGDFTDPNNPMPPNGMCPDGPTYPDCKGGAMCMTMMNACISDP